jgi:ribosome-binding factor A
MRSTPRTRRLGEIIKEALADVLATEVSDPRLDFVTVTSVDVSVDLKVADVYVTTHGDEARYARMIEGLRSADGRIRTGLGKRVVLRTIPELRYHVDTSVDESMRIAEALKTPPPHVPDDAE